MCIVGTESILKLCLRVSVSQVKYPDNFSVKLRPYYVA